MSTITRCAATARGTMKHYVDGRAEVDSYTGSTWRCDACGLVWERRHQALACGERSHAGSYDDVYWSKVTGQDGRPVPVSTTYTRRAIHREEVR